MSEFDELVEPGAADVAASSTDSGAQRPDSRVSAPAKTGAGLSGVGRSGSKRPRAEPPVPESSEAAGVPTPSGHTGARQAGRATASGRCSRWMFHRKGVYCKECGKVGT